MAIVYNLTTNFTDKDTLPENDPAKVIRGAEHQAEYLAIKAAFAEAAPTSSPAFTGTATFASAQITNLTVTNPIIGSVTGSVTGDIVGNVTGNVTGDLTGNVTGDLTGTVLTASQPNITSVGTLTGFTSTGIDDNATSTALTIDSSGKVGIGTSSPTVPLEVIGDINYDGRIKASSPAADGSAAAPSICVGFDYDTGFFKAAPNTLGITTGGTERMRINSIGNVGIGTTNPSVSLDVLCDSSSAIGYRLRGRASDNQSGIQFTDNLATEAYAAIDGKPNGLNIAAASTRTINFITNGTERMSLDPSGNLLVGTTNSPIAGTPKTVKYGVGVQANSISNRLAITAGVATTVLNMADVLNGATGTGLYLVTIVRTGGSVARRWVAIVGLTPAAAIIYSTLDSNDITVTTSDLNIQVNTPTSASFDCTAIPLAITP